MVVSDLAQTVIIVFSSLLLMGLVWADFGGPGGLYKVLVDQFGNSVVDWKPPASHEMLGIIGIIAWTIGTAVGYGGDVAPMATKRTTRITVSFSDQEYSALEAIAREQDASMSWVVRRAVNEFLSQNADPQQEIFLKTTAAEGRT